MRNWVGGRGEGLMRKLWGGAYDAGGRDFATEFGRSFEADLNLFAEDVEGSIAHARMLGKQGILPLDEAGAIVRGLEEILAEGAQYLPRDVEDIHTAVELRLREKVGDLAGKLHTGRSRNDQVATDARLWVRRRAREAEVAVKGFQSALLERGEEHADTLLPGVTHQQHGQPVTLGFHFLAYFFAFQRHGWRLECLREVCGGSPLGSAALAGTPFEIDRGMTARELGFDGVMANALDATSDRSFVLDALHCAALIGLDLSRMGNEFVLWSSPEFGFVRLPDDLTTGSSIMPQKRNPDVAELVRGRAGVTVGNWVKVATMLKGLVMGYNRDTQDDKPPLYESFGLVRSSLEGCEAMVRGAEFRLDRMRESMRGDFSTATDLADALAARGMAFREAHELAGRVVRGCMERGIGLEDVTEEYWSELAPGVDFEVLAGATVEASRGRRESEGGTGPQAVRAQLRLARQMLDSDGFGQKWG